MKLRIPASLIVVLAFLLFSGSAKAKTSRKQVDSVRMPDGIETSIGNLQFFDGVPSVVTVNKLYDNLDKMRGVAAYLHSVSIASMSSLKKASDLLGADRYNKAVIFETGVDSKTVCLTGDPRSVCLSSFLDSGLSGPIVLELPPHSFGAINDIWGRHITDTGISGADKGQGGKYLILPPQYKEEVPDGFIVVRPQTFKVWLFIYGITGNGNCAEVVKTFKTMKVYPLSETLNHKEMTFINGSGQSLFAVFPGDIAFFHAVNDIVQSEPSSSMSPELLGLLSTIGIAKGREFKPDFRMRTILTEAAVIGDATSRALLYRPRNSEDKLYKDKTSWWMTGFPANDNPLLLHHGVKNIDGRTMFHYAFSGITSAMTESHVQISGQAKNEYSNDVKAEVRRGMSFAVAFMDSNGNPFNGRKTYKLNLPQSIPSKQGWSVTIYDTQFRSMVQVNGQATPSFGSNDKLVKNDDGSTDIYFSSRKPEGDNWIRTRWDKGWFAIFRLYEPLKPWFDHSWRPGEIHLQR